MVFRQGDGLTGTVIEAHRGVSGWWRSVSGHIVNSSYDSSELLTERQWEAITEAVERGFYETPRGCTLDELAESLDIYKSSANRLLHRAESRIIKEFVAEAAP